MGKHTLSQKKLVALSKFLSYVLRHHPESIGLSPEFLFHGTASRFISSIKEKGLLKKGRLYVHLSKDRETAYKVGKRHGKPVIIKISAFSMYQDNYKFFFSSNGVWLTEHVPPEYIEF